MRPPSRHVAVRPWHVAILLFVVAMPTQAAGRGLRIEEFPGPLRVLEDVAVVNVTVEADCPPPELDSTVILSVVEAPTWSILSLEPSTFNMTYADCRDGRVVQRGVLRAALTINAPAFHPAAFTVRGRFEEATGASTVEVTRTVVADYFSVVDVIASRTIVRIGPGEHAAFPLLVTNFGNGRTNFDFSVEPPVPAGWRTDIPARVTLGAKAEGAEDTQTEILFRARPGDRSGYVNEVVTFRIRHFASYALREGYEGEPQDTNLTVTLRGFGGDVPLALPAVLLAFAAAAVAPSRRRRRQQ